MDELLLLEIARAGLAARGAVQGVVAGIREVLHDAADLAGRLTSTPTASSRPRCERVRQHLRESKARRILVGAANDPSALGAARAFQEAGRAATCAIVGQNAEPDARAELRAEHAAHRLGRLLPRALRRRLDPPRPRHPRPPRRAAGGVRQAPDHHARERRPPLSER